MILIFVYFAANSAVFSYLKAVKKINQKVGKISLEILGLSSNQATAGSFALVLGEKGGKSRRLPIVIGMYEAQSIPLELEKISPGRPMTHDLFRAFAESFRYDIMEIFISELREGIFYAKIICRSQTTLEEFEIDARPSDAIAIGLRFDAPIYTQESVLAEGGIVPTDEEREEMERAAEEEQEADDLHGPENEPQNPGDWASLSEDQLNEMLNEALAAEDYEKAAKIRDELNGRA